MERRCAKQLHPKNQFCKKIIQICKCFMILE
jgi:hypothetical protein